MSNTLNITCLHSTYISQSSVSNNSGLTLLPTKAWQSGVTPPVDTPILQFQIPSYMKFKKINSVSLYYRITQTDQIDTIFGAHIRAFTASQICVSDIRYSNYTTYGTFTEPLEYRNQVVLSAVGGSYPSSKEETVDITSLFTNNVKNDIFSVSLNIWVFTIYTKVYSANSSYPPILIIDYEDVLPTPPTILYPSNVYLSEDSAIEFKWAFNSESGAVQGSYVLEWRKTGDIPWISLTSGTGTTNTYTAPPKSFPAGQIEWRCKTTDQLSQESDYSYASFIIMGKPSAPIITSVLNNALTTITWNSSDQIAYDIKLLKDGVIIDASKKSSIERTYSPSMFLQDGTYEFRIRTMNSYSLWSDYTSYVFAISTTKPSKPNLKVMLSNTEVYITTETSGYLYRVEGGESTLIAVLTEATTYIDKGIKHNTRTGYFFRVYNVGYTDSDTYYVTANIRGFIVDNVNKSVNFYQSEDKYLQYNEKQTEDRVLINYSGRDYPVEIAGEFKNRSISRVCFSTEEQYVDLMEIYYSALPIYYRDNRGRRFRCSITEPNIVNAFLDQGYTLEITFTQIDDEVVEINA